MTLKGALLPPGSEGWRSFADTPEDLYGSLSQYYDLPTLSMRSATYRLAVTKNNPAFSHDMLFGKGLSFRYTCRGEEGRG